MAKTLDPLAQFQSWFNDAISQGVPEANAMVLATVTPEQRPDARVVLLKGLEQGGLTFFTNYLSRKGAELEGNPFATAVFYWRELGRQIRVEGRVEKVSAKESDDYWKTRPRESQVSGATSAQSQTIPSYEELQNQASKLRKEFENQEIPRPPHWGGYRLVPDRVEFWTQGDFRLHRRTVFKLVSGEWTKELLSP